MTKKIEGLTIDLGLDTIKVDAGLKGVSRKFSVFSSEMKSSMSVFDKGEKSVQKYETQLGNLNKKLDIHKVAVRNARHDYEKMVKEHGEGSKQADYAAKKYNEEVSALNNLERYVGKVTNEFKEFKNQQRIAANGWTKFGKGLEVTGSKFQALGSSMSDFSRKLTMAFTAPVLALAGTALVKGLSRLIGIDEAKAKLEGLGHTAESIESIMGSALDSVRGTSFGLDEAATTAANAVAAGIEKGDDLTRYLSLTGDAAAIAGTSLADMGSIFNKVQTTGKAYNGELQMLAERGLPVYQWLAKEADTTAESVFNMAKDGEVSTELLLNAIEKNIGGASQKMGAKSFKAGIANMWAAVGRLGASFLDAGGEGGGFFSKMKPLISDMTNNIDKLGGYAEDLGKKFGDAFANTIEKVKNAAKWFNGLSDTNKKLVASMAGLLVVSGPIIGVLAKFLFMMGGIMNFLGPVAKSIGKAGGLLKWLKGIFVAFTGPVGITIAAVTALGVGIFILYKKSETFRKIIGAVISGIKKFGVAVAQGWVILKEKTVKVWNEVSTFLTGAWTSMRDIGIQVWESVSSFFITIWDGIKGAFNSSINWIKGIWKKVMGSEIVTEFMKTFNVWKMTFTTVFSFLIGKVSSGFNAMKSVVTIAMNVIKKIWSAVWMGLSIVVMPVFNKVKTGALAFFNALKVGFTVFFNTIKPILNAFKDVIKTVWTTVVSVVKTNAGIMKSIISQGMNNIKSIISIIWNGIKTVFQVGWELIKGIFSATMMFLRGDIKGGMNRIMTTITTVMNLVKKFFSTTWATIKNIFSSTLTTLWNAIKTYFTSMKNSISAIMASVLNYLRTVWNTILSTVKRIVSSLWTAVKNTFANMKTSISNLAKGAKDGVINQWTRLKNGVTTLANALKDKVTGIFDKMVDAAKALPGKIKTGIINAKDKAVSGIKSLANSMMGKFGSLVNGLIGGVNTITGKLGIDKKISQWSVPQYAKGTGGHPGGAMVVGDRYGRELVQFPNGQTLLSPDTDTLVPNAPKGTKVIPNRITEQILAGKVPMYSGGIGGPFDGVVNTGKRLVNAGKDKFHKVKDTVKGWLGDVWDYASNPKKLVNLMIEKLGLSVTGLSGGAKSMAKAGFSFIKGKAVDFIKDKFDIGGGGNVPMKFGNLVRTSGFGYRTHPITGQKHLHGGVDFAGPIGTAIKALVGGVVTSSGWNSGGYGNLVTIRNGIYDYYYAHMQKTLAKVGTSVKKGDILGLLGSTGQSTGPHLHYEVRRNGQRINPGIGGFADGGLIKKEQLAWVGEGNKEEVVIPTGDPSKRTTAMKLLALAAKKLGAGGGAGSSVGPNNLPGYGSSGDYNAIAGLTEKVDKLTMLMVEMLGIQRDQLDAILAGHVIHTDGRATARVVKPHLERLNERKGQGPRG